VSDLLDAPTIGSIIQITPSKIRVPFTPGADFLSSYVTMVNGDPANPSRVTSMSLKADTTKFLVGLKVNGVALPSVYANLVFAPGVPGADGTGTYQDATLVPPYVDFIVPANILEADVLSCVPSVISECARDSTNSYDFNSVVAAASSLVGKIGVMNSLPSVQIDLVQAANEGITANFKVFFATQAAKDAYKNTNRASGSLDLITFMKVFNADSDTDALMLSSDNQLGPIGVGVANAATLTKTYTPTQYKDAVSLLGKKIGVSFSSKDSAGLNQQTIYVASSVVKFIELVGTLASFVVDTTGTSDSPTITATWVTDRTFGSSPTGFKLGYSKDNYPSSLDKGAWSSSTSYIVLDSVTYNGSTYVCIAAAAAAGVTILSPYSYSSGIAYPSGAQLQYLGNNYTRKQDGAVGIVNTATGVLPTDATKWTLDTPILTPVILPTNINYWTAKFTTSTYPTIYAAGQRSVTLNSDPAGTPFTRAAIVYLSIQGLYFDRNSSDPAARLQGAQAFENAPFGSHSVKSQVVTVAYDNTVNTATISLKDKIVDMVDIVPYAVDYPEYVSPTTEVRLVTKIADDIAMSLNLQPITPSSGLVNKASFTMPTTPGVEYKKYYQQYLTVGQNTYSSPIQLITLKLVKNIDLSAPTVVYKATLTSVAPAAYNPAAWYQVGDKVLYLGSVYTRNASVGAGQNANIVTVPSAWTNNGVFSATSSVTLADKAAAVAALTNSSYSDVRTEFGVTIDKNGADLTNWSNIAIPNVATPDAMAASYKSGTGLASFNAGDASLVEGVFKLKYSGVWSASILMVSSTEGGKLIAIPSNAVFSSSI
jgi:hypothetical protein